MCVDSLTVNNAHPDLRTLISPDPGGWRYRPIPVLLIDGVDHYLYAEMFRR